MNSSHSDSIPLFLLSRDDISHLSPLLEGEVFAISGITGDSCFHWVKETHDVSIGTPRLSECPSLGCINGRSAMLENLKGMFLKVPGMAVVVDVKCSVTYI